MEDMRTRYLEQGEKERSRKLYETAFPEDSKEFTDYYYTWKTRENEILVMEEANAVKDDLFQGMMHLNPYLFQMNGSLKEIPYIVAVATRPDCRRQGKMGQLMQTALKDMEQKKIPFTFLLPADPAYYQGLGFVFFPRQSCVFQEKDVLRGKTGSAAERKAALAKIDDTAGKWLCQELKWQKAGQEDVGELADFSNQILAKRADIYIWRNAQYYRRLLAETAAENGGVLVGRIHGSICGILSYGAGIRQNMLEAEVKELLWKSPFSRQEAQAVCRCALKEAGLRAEHITFSPSRMMMRITSLQSLAGLLRSREKQSFSVEVTDAVVTANNGCFQIEINARHSHIKRIAKEDVKEQMDISQLARQLFSHQTVCLSEWV